MFGCALVVAGALAGCAPEPRPVPLVPAAPSPPAAGVLVPVDRPWVDSGATVRAGTVVSVRAAGTIRVRCFRDGQDERVLCVGPEGTYLYDDDDACQRYPLPAAAGGPAPPFCLIGRIGDGPAFFIGARKSWIASESGPLWLGLNDFDFTDNCGAFSVEITQPAGLQPVAFQAAIPARSREAGRSFQPDVPCDGPEGPSGMKTGSDWPGGAVAGAQVVVFYIDGLRPDVVREMAAMGHLPHIRQTFLEGGVEAAHCFTAFPSDTITSNGTMWTGCFSDRHGIKGQVRFSRRTLHSESYLDPVGPNRAARLLAPQGIDKLLHDAHAETVGLLHGNAAEQQYRQRNVTGVDPLFAHLRRAGGDWATGALPMMTEVPPLLWSRSLVRHLPYFQAHEAWKTIDDANTHYALFELLDRKAPVTIIWLPETDSISHKYSRGQFGLTRRTIASADQMIGRVVTQLRAAGRLPCTYLMLVSDHGHHGGRDFHLSHFDLANEVFYKPREATPDGRWAGGGLGLSVRAHRFWNRHQEDGSKEFVFIDGDADGTARVFLPRCGFRSGRWLEEPRPGDMLAYPIAAHRPAVNLIETLISVEAVHGNGCVDRPVDLVLLKLDDKSILIATADRGCAVIDREHSECGGWAYRYTVVTDVRPTGDGRVAFTPLEHPQIDPLGLLQLFDGETLRHYYDERAWLQMTTHTTYPDSVVALTRHMLWQENLAWRECEFAPDLVVTARSGWYFGMQPSPGTMHGYPLADSMQATLYVAGPNIRRGARLEEPCRLADLTPTILEMTGTPYPASELDGRPLRMIYECDCERSLPVASRPPGLSLDLTPGVRGRDAPGRHSSCRPVYWHDIDLGAWQPLCYHELPPYPDLPCTINRPDSPCDLNNIVRSAATITEINVLRVFDDILSPLSCRECGLLPAVERRDLQVRTSGNPCRAELASVVKLPLLAVGDYSQTSLGNLRRLDAGVDWLQSRSREFHTRHRLDAGPLAVPNLALNHTIDGSQAALWNIYDFCQRFVAELIDEKLIPCLEDGIDRSVNHFGRQPGEVIVPLRSDRWAEPQTR